MSDRIEPLFDSGDEEASRRIIESNARRRATEPLSVTPLGAIAYRLDAIAGELVRFADVWDHDEIEDLAQQLWSAVNDLVAYGMNVKESADG